MHPNKVILNQCIRNLHLCRRKVVTVYSKDGVAGNTSDGHDNNGGDACVHLSVYIHSFVIRRQSLSDLIHFASFTNSYVGSYRG